jgi:hypothetical protein
MVEVVMLDVDASSGRRQAASDIYLDIISLGFVS